jgi:hypothetical protein
MESSAERVHNAIAAMANTGLGLFGRPKYERRIAIAFVKKIPLPLDDQIAETARSLRICGILMCATEGIEITTRCPCFLALAKDKTKEQLQEALEARLDIVI